MPSSPDTDRVAALAERPVQLRGSSLAQAALKAFGWRLDFDGLPSRQGVLIAYPHTSNWDFVLGMTAKWAMGLHVSFWAKDTLFKVPLFGRWLRWLGGVPVHRHAPKGTVAETVALLQQARARDEFFWLALAPEGTRARRETWRSGFHAVAVQAGVPLAVAYLDYGRRRVGVAAYLRLSGDERTDLAAIARQLEGVRGKRPELASPIRL